MQIGKSSSSTVSPDYSMDLIAKSRHIPDKLDDAFEGMTDDDAFIDGWFAVRKISGCVIKIIDFSFKFFCMVSL